MKRALVLLATALLAGPAFGQTGRAAMDVTRETVNVDGSSFSYAAFPAPSGCASGYVPYFDASLKMACSPTVYAPSTDTTTVGTLAARNVTAIPLPASGSVTVTPVLSKIGAITVVAGSALADGDGLVVGDGTGVVPIEFDAAPGDGTSGGAVPIVFDGTETATQIRDAVKAILDASGRDWTTSAQGADGIGLVRATPGATGGAITESVTNAGFAVTDWTDPTHATTYTYSMQACYADGSCNAAGAASSTAAGVATLSAANPNRLTWSGVPGSALYKIRRDVGGATQGVIWSGTALTVDDAGLAGDSSAKPLTDGTGTVTGKVPGVGGTLKVCASNAKFTTGCDLSCDGTADNVQIQAAIDALPATGGSVVLSDGTFNISTTLFTQFGLWLSGQGPGTIIKAAAGATGSSIIEAKNDGAVRPATAANRVTISDLTLDTNSVNGLNGLYFRGYAGAVQFARVERVTIRGGAGTAYGILTDIVTDAAFLDLDITSWGTGDSVIETRRTTRLKVANSTFGGNLFQVYADATTKDMVITGNTFLGVTVKTTDNGGTVDGLVFANNTWRQTATAHKMVIWKNVKNLVVTGNTFDATAYAAPTLPLMTLEATATDYLVTDNILRTGTHTVNARAYGCILADGPRGTIARNLLIVNAASNYGVRVGTGAGPLRIEHNSIEGDSSANSLGVQVASGTGIHVEGNHYSGVATGLDIAAGATSTRVVGPLWTTSVATPIADAGTTTSYQGVSALLPTYADNAAAITGGLAAGDPYRTSTGVLMVTYTP